MRCYQHRRKYKRELAHVCQYDQSSGILELYVLTKDQSKGDYHR